MASYEDKFNTTAGNQTFTGNTTMSGTLDPAGGFTGTGGSATETNFGLVKMQMKNFSASTFNVPTGQNPTFSHKTMYLKVYEASDGQAYADLTMSFRFTTMGAANQILTISVPDLSSYVLPDAEGFGTQYIQAQQDEMSSNTAERSPIWRLSGDIQWSAEPFSTGNISPPINRRFMWSFLNVPVALQ